MSPAVTYTKTPAQRTTPGFVSFSARKALWVRIDYCTQGGPAAPAITLQWSAPMPNALHELGSAAPNALHTPLPNKITEHSSGAPLKVEQDFEIVGWLNLVEQKLRSFAP